VRDSQRPLPVDTPDFRGLKKNSCLIAGTNLEATVQQRDCARVKEKKKRKEKREKREKTLPVSLSLSLSLSLFLSRSLSLSLSPLHWRILGLYVRLSWRRYFSISDLYLLSPSALSRST